MKRALLIVAMSKRSRILDPRFSHPLCLRLPEAQGTYSAKCPLSSNFPHPAHFRHFLTRLRFLLISTSLEALLYGSTAAEPRACGALKSRANNRREIDNRSLEGIQCAFRANFSWLGFDLPKSGNFAVLGRLVFCTQWSREREASAKNRDLDQYFPEINTCV